MNLELFGLTTSTLAQATAKNYVMSKDDPVAMDVDSDDDPITASYPVFLNPALPLGRRLLVLQHPNRTDDSPRPPPSELRLKADSGMVEVDMPLDYTTAYDREKGQKWGRTLQTSVTSKSGGSHGLAGGFGFGAVQRSTGGRKKNDDDDELMDWNESVRQDKVLRTQTLGGQYPDADEVQYMVGVFQGKDLHLTPVSSLVHLRPQLHHIDATTQSERQATSAASKEPTGATGGPSAAAGPAARAIHMTIKTPTEGETVAAETIADRLRFVQSEPWRKMRYTDENEEAAWDVYNDSLFLRTAEDEAETEDKKTAVQDQKTLEQMVPEFNSKWNDDQLLEAVSGIKKPEQESPAEPEPAVVPVKPEPKGKAADDGRKLKTTRTRGGGAAGASRRTSRSKA